MENWKIPEQAKKKFTPEQLLQKTAEILERLREKTVDFLRPYAAKELAADQIYACFELFHMQSYGLNYNTYFVEKRDGKEILKTEWTEATEMESFLPELNQYVDKTFSETDYFNEKDGVKFTELHEKQILEWFAECWKVAGGDQCKVPTYFAFDKEYQCRDLFTGEVLSEEDTAKKLGYDVVID